MRLTRAGYAALGVAALLYLSGALFGYDVLRLLGGAGAGAVVAALVHVFRRPPLGVTRTVFPDRVERGKGAVAQLRVVNDGARRISAFAAYDLVGGAKGKPVRFGALGGGDEATRAYPLPTDRRGVLTVGPLVLARQDVLGLARAEVRSESRSEVWVLPRTHPVVPVPAGRARQYEGAAVDELARGSQVFHALREYVRGDDYRSIHWRTTARAGRLMVRDHVDPHTPDVTVLLDTDERALPPERFEEAVDFAASLLLASVERAQPARLTTTDGVTVTSAGGALDAGPLLDRLALVQQHQAGVDVVSRVDRAATGSTLVLVGGGFDEVTFLRLARLRPRYRFVAAVGFDERAHVGAPVVVLHADDAAAAARDWNAAVAR